MRRIYPVLIVLMAAADVSVGGYFLYGQLFRIMPEVWPVAFSARPASQSRSKKKDPAVEGRVLG